MKILFISIILITLPASAQLSNANQYFNIVSGLQQWRSLKHASSTSIVEVLIVGDSVTEGGVTTGGIQDYTNSYAGHLRTNLQGQFGYAGLGWISPIYSGLGSDPRMNPSGPGWTDMDTETNTVAGPFGLSQKGTSAGGNTYIDIPNQNYTYFDIIYSVNTNSSTGASTVGVAINGVNKDSFTVGSSYYETWVRRRENFAGPGTIRITCPTTGYFYFHGIVLYSDTKGILVHSVWESGHTISNYLALTSGHGTLAYGATNAMLIAGAIKPALTIFETVVNDYRFQTPLSNYTNFIQTALAPSTNYGSVILLAGPLRDTNSFSWTIPQNSYQDAMRGIASMNGNSVAQYDMMVRWQSYSNAYLNLGFIYDNVHPNPAGDTDMALGLEGAVNYDPTSSFLTLSVGKAVFGP